MNIQEIILYLAFVLPATIGWITGYIKQKMWHGIVGTIVGIGQIVLLTYFS